MTKDKAIKVAWACLVGMEIKEVGFDKEQEMPMLKMTNGAVVWVSQDPEGNAPGDLFWEIP